MDANLNASDEGTLPPPKQNRSMPANVSLIATEPSDEQKIFLVNYLKMYPYLLSANPAAYFMNASQQHPWQELADLLNSFGTSVKSLEDWKKYWVQLMSSSKIVLRRVDMQGYNIMDYEFMRRRKPITLPTAEQKDFLINFIIENQEVMYQRDRKNYDRKKRAKKWQEVAAILNSMKGPKKSIEDWKKSWNAIALRAKTAVARGDTNYGDRVATVIAFIYPERGYIHRNPPRVGRPPANRNEFHNEPFSEFVELPEVPPPDSIHDSLILASEESITFPSEETEILQSEEPITFPPVEPIILPPVEPIILPTEEPVILPTEEPVMLPSEELCPPPAYKALHKSVGRKISMAEYKIEQEKLEIQKKLLALEEKQTLIEELRANALERMLKHEETKISDSTRILLQTKRLEIAYRQAKEEEATLVDIGKFVGMTEAKSKLLLDVLTKVTDIINNSY